MRVSFVGELDVVKLVTHVGEERVSWGQPRTPHIPRKRSHGSQITGVLLYLCVMPTLLTQNDQILHGITYMYGEGHVFEISHALYCNLHKFVARFVGDS